MNQLHDKNSAIKEISKSLTVIIKAQNSENELNEEQICSQLIRVYGYVGQIAFFDHFRLLVALF